MGPVSLVLRSNVGIDRADLGKIPSPLCREYSYCADTNPPVLKTALQHFTEHPDHAPQIAYHRPRIPKKLREKLSLPKDSVPREGYGLYIQERICWTGVFIAEAMFSTCCIVFAVAWCIKNNGGIQDGFAIAGTGVSYGTVLLGALQAVAQRA